ncbi:MAG: hypothetical protein KGD70_15445 [Candidatus Lokiarchaeota archaeon]|nr:hypothetical protein [Candidatus Lokiarchaeota archaeon]MCJ7714100.1 hypothetical protein [Candidatus Bathyarchaeota archaeon]
MKKKSLMLTNQENMFVDLTFHDFPVELLKTFVKKIVQPYFSGNTNQAIKTLMEKTITEEEIVKNHLTNQ